MAIIQIDDGTREYEIQNKYGETICKLHFRPGDLSLLNRWQELRGVFMETIKPLEELSINADGTADDDASIKALQEAEQRFREALGKLIDSRDVGAIFDTRNPFSSVGGRFFAENVIEMLDGIISKVLAEEAEAAKARTAKYIEEAPDDRQPSAGA